MAEGTDDVIGSGDATGAQAFREANYNATVTQVRRLHDDLAIFRVRHDEGPIQFDAGQYTVLGLGTCEPRIKGCQAETTTDRIQLIRRAYSISCPILDQGGDVVRATGAQEVEFYVALVRKAAGKPPALTPRLFGVQPGQRIHMSSKCHGHYTLRDIPATADVVFVSTGTGEAPHNAMLADLLNRGHKGRLVATVCTRFEHDLGYLETHRRLEKLFPNYKYLPLTTREPINLDASLPNYIGKVYLQEYLSSGSLEAKCGFEFCASRTHVFLCGNPTMIGVPQRTHDPTLRYPKPVGMVELLEHRGFLVEQPHEVGNIHFEKYW